MPPPSSYRSPLDIGGVYRSASLNRLNQSRETKAIQPLRSQSVSRVVDSSPFGVAGATYIPFHSFSSVKPTYYRVNPNFSLRNHIYDKYYYFSPRYRRTQFHRHYYHGQIEHYPYRWNFQSKGTITGQYYWVRRLQFDPIEYGAYRYYDPYRRYYDPYHDSYIKLYDYRPRPLIA
jgi:hypothetical protein